MPDEPEPELSPAVTDAFDDRVIASDETRTVRSGGDAEPPGGRLVSVYGVLSALLGVVGVAALVLGLITFFEHRDEANERAYRSRVLQTAAGWTQTLINLNAQNVDKGLQQLHSKTAGALNQEFDASVENYRKVVQRIQSRSQGRVEAVAIDTLARVAGSDDKMGGLARRTDPVMVLATSVAENVGGKPETVHWALRLDVSDIDGQLLISKLESIR